MNKQSILSIIVLLFMIGESLFSQNDTLIYIGDPMCSWCYGFSPELDKVLKEFPNAPFEMVMGGLRPDGRETIHELADFLKEHWLEVSKISGQNFNYRIFEKEDIFYNTEPACRAVLIVKELKREVMFDFFKAVQKAFYYDNVNPLVEDTYISIAQAFGIDEKKFTEMFRGHNSKVSAYNDFELAQKMGVKGFPSLIAKIDGKYFQISSGYSKAEKMIARLKNNGFGK
jgi:putative protein-disulfide isomerase